VIRRFFPSGFPPAEPVPKGSWRPALLAAFGLAALMVLLYLPAVDFRLLSFDDYYYTQNDLVRGGLNGANIVRIFTELPEEDLFTPLTQLSYMADVELFGNRSRGFHLTSILLHAVAMGLLLLVLWRMTGRLGESALAAALVAFHPLRVESVAWVTERKDVLSVLFLLLTLSCHLRYARTRKWGWYGAALLCFLLGLLAKPMLVTVPFLLLLADFWPLGRFRADAGAGGNPSAGRRFLTLAAEKVPFLALSLFVSLATLHLQQEKALVRAISLVSRVEHSLSAYFAYLYQTVWPVDLVFRYFQTPWDQFSGTLLPAAAGLLILTALVARFSATRPYLAFGWCWYLVSLFPVSGIMPAGIQWISDRFTYVPHIGLAVAFAWLAGGVSPRRSRPVLLALAVLLLLPLGVRSRSQLYSWKDGATLFGRGVAANAQDPRYLNQYIEELVEVGDLPRAREQMERARRFVMDPWYGAPLQITHLSLLDKSGDRRGAIEQARAYLREDPRFFRTRVSLADRLLSEGRFAEAAAEYRQVLEVPTLSPRDRRFVSEELGFALFNLGKEEEALSLYLAALRGNPLGSSLHYRLGLLLARRGKPEEAMAHYGLALKINPEGLRPRIGIADLLLAQGNVTTAVLQYEEVARRAPGKAESLYARGRILEAAGMKIRARSLYESALQVPAVHPETVDAVRRRLAEGMTP
jgi:Flp pilus assembly protein TadD